MNLTNFHAKYFAMSARAEFSYQLVRFFRKRTRWLLAPKPRPLFEPLPASPASRTLFESRREGAAQIAVVIPLFNYARYIVDALDSVKRQSLPEFDLIVIDDSSTDNSALIAQDWLKENHARFVRAMLAQTDANSGIAQTRNLGFSKAETPFVFPLDADNLLEPDCLVECLAAITNSNAAGVHTVIQEFGDQNGRKGEKPWSPDRLARGNYIDNMALIKRSAWEAVGGYDPVNSGWEDYDLWCKFVEHSFWLAHVPKVLAQYRVHKSSMLRTTTDLPANRRLLLRHMRKRHPWLKI